MSLNESLRHAGAGTGDAGLAPGAARQRGEGPVELVEDLVELPIARGGRAVVVSDLHLTGTVTEASRGCTDELINVLSSWSEPGAFVINGDGFEQLHEPVAPIGEILAAHGEWTRTVRAFADQPGHDVIVISGNHDGNIAWDRAVATTLQQELGARFVALAADLVFDTAAGPQRVHIEHGNQDDQYNAFVDPRSPLDTPTGHHVVRQVLPQLDHAVRPGGLLDGLYELSEPMMAGEMVGSRLLYRGIGKRGWFLALPFVAALALRLVAFLPRINEIELWSNVQGWLFFFGVATMVLLVLAVVITVVTLLGVHRSLADTEVGQRSGIGAHNAATREHAARVIELGYAGMVAGHTHTPELSVVGDGFYANSGCGVEVLGARRTHFGLPRPFTSVRRIARVELAGLDHLEVRLIVGDAPIPAASLLERLVIKPDRDTPTKPSVVASLPTGATWPVDPTSLGTFDRMRRTRQAASGLLLAMAVIDFVSVNWGPHLKNFAVFTDRIPDDIPQASSVLVVLIAVAFVGLARGLRRGYRQTWLAAVVLLLSSAVVLFLEGIFYEAATLNLALAVWLLVERRHFRVLMSGTRRRLLWISVITIAAVILAASVAVIFDQTLDNNLTLVGLATVLLLMIVIRRLTRRPNEGRMRSGDERMEAEGIARELLERLGGDTFDHGCVRDDKALLFASGGLVSYTVIDGRMAVSPDPICALDDRSEVWSSTMDFADTHGWSVAVLAASATWLPIYHAAGLHDVYLGDEAIVDCGQFVAQPPDGATLDQACATARANGYRVEVVEASSIDGAVRARLDALAVGAEIGAPGQGFATSMGRVATRDDAGVLLALCRTGDGEIAAFDQFVPASAVGGYTLDLACTVHLGPDAEPVGHLLLVESLRWLYGHGARALSLGLAASGGPNYGEARNGRLPLERQVLSQFADGSELDRRRRVDAEYGPVWRPRYVVTDAMRRRGERLERRLARARAAAAAEAAVPTPS